jgi:hypothetical protein
MNIKINFKFTAVQNKKTKRKNRKILIYLTYFEKNKKQSTSNQINFTELIFHYSNSEKGKNYSATDLKIFSQKDSFSKIILNLTAQGYLAIVFKVF